MNQNSFNPRARWDRFEPGRGADNGERIEVLARFKQGRVIPENFILNRREYPVDLVNYNWQERLGQAVVSYFSVTSAGMVYQLSFNSENFFWQLDRIIE